MKKYINRKLNYLKIHGIISNDKSISLCQTAFNASYYLSIRYLYNVLITQNNFKYSALRAAYYLTMRELAYSSMFRFNKSGEFNVAYGGASYNNKRMLSFIDFYKSNFIKNKFIKNNIYNDDFELFLNKLNLNSNDFIFLDPPYDSNFSTYDNNNFDSQEQKRLAKCINKQNAKLMLVVKDSPLIRKLYPIEKYNYSTYNKRYDVNFNNRNKQNVKHLIITNY